MRKIFYYSFIFLVLITLFQGCTSAKMVSNKEIGFTKKPKKIFIFINHTKDSKSFWKSMAVKLGDEFTRRGIETVIYMRDPLSLETEDDFNKKISDYAPEALLIIKQTVTSGDWRAGDYELSLVDGETKKPVWKSQLNIHATGSVYMSNAVIDSLKVIISKLTKDKII
jgi:hypothetical protein